MFRAKLKYSNKTLVTVVGAVVTIGAVIAGSSYLLGAMNPAVVVQKDPSVGQFGQKIFDRNIQAIQIAKAAGKFAQRSELRSIANRWQVVLASQDKVLSKWLASNRGSAYVNPLDTQFKLPKAQVMHVFTSKHKDSKFAALMRDSVLKFRSTDSETRPMDSTLAGCLAKINALNQQTLGQLESLAVSSK